MLHFSPTASAEGTTEQPGCDCDGGCVSSVSSEWASMPFASAASIGPQRTFDATTVETFSPPYARANLIANFPGGRSDPEMAAASVSRIMCFVFSTTPSGSARPPADAMYSESVVISGLTFAPIANSSRGIIETTTAPPAVFRRSRLCIDIAVLGCSADLQVCRVEQG